jgi:hypothetical protein
MKQQYDSHASNTRFEKGDNVWFRAVRFQKFYLGPGFGFFGTKKPRFGSVSVIFKKEEQYKCMNSFMYVSSIFTK